MKINGIKKLGKIMNILNFISIEWWKNKNEDGLGHAYVGITDSGDIYLTFDIRKAGDKIFPVFSPICKVGGKNAHTMKAYLYYRHLFSILDGYSITEIVNCDYGILYDCKPYKFIK